MSLIEEIRAAVIEGDAKTTTAKLELALAEGLDPNEILRDGLIAGMQEVGRLFEEGEFFVPEMLIAARAMTAALKILKPRLMMQGIVAVGRVAIGTVQGDIHDIGKSLVIMMLEGAGFEVIDLGIDVPPEKFIDAAQQGYDIIGMSALLTTTMPNMRTTIDAMKHAGVRDKVMIMVGGAPVTQNYADDIGADGYAADAAAAARLAKVLIDSRKAG